MAFNFGDAQGDASAKPFLFQKNVNYGDIKGDEKRSMSFRILPAFPEHDGPLTQEDALTYVPAVSLEGGVPIVADWAYAMLISRCYVKGSRSILSRKMIGDDNDPLCKVIDYCSHDNAWAYVIKEQGEWGKPNRVPARLPIPKKEFLLNVLTLDDEKPGVKVGIIKSVMCMYDLCSTKQGKEGYALQQREVTDEEYQNNPSSIWVYGDITDPNSAPIFKALKGATNDNRMVNMIKPSLSIDPASGRQHLDRMPLTAEQLAARVDLAHPETYLCIPTPEEQVEQIIGNLGGRNASGIHEYDMLRAVLPDFADLIPDVPAAPGVVNQVQGFTPTQPQPQAAPVATPATGVTFTPTAPKTAQAAPAATAAPAGPKTFTPSTPKTFTPPANAGTKAPSFVPKAEPVAAPVQKSPASVPGVPGETFDGQDWVSRYSGATTDPAKVPF